MALIRAFVFSAAVAVALAVAAPSSAGWLVQSSGSGHAKARTLVGNAPSATKSGVVTITVNLSWAATPGATGYTIQRTGGVGSVGGTCAGTLSATSCADSPVVPLTTYTYRVTPVNSGWTGTASSGTTITI